jgi:hypothetical protein
MGDDMTENAASTVGPAVDAQLELVRSLKSENEVLIDRLRGVQIPQHVGMTAAGRALATDVPRVLVAQVQADLDSGALGKRWEAALARAGSDAVSDKVEAVLAALAMLLVDQAKATARYVSTRAEEWAADAYRLEGQASALEEQTRRLSRAHVGIEQSRASGEAREAVQEQRRNQRANGEAPSLRAVSAASAEAQEG